MKIYPLKLKPVTKQILWGGTYLCENFGIGEKGQSIAEAWVMTDRPDGCNTIDNGDYRGMTLDEYINQASKAAVIGKDADFPLLIKLIDANDRLSVQVHPDDEYAAANGLDAGKTEMWYIVDAKPGAKLVYGLKDKKVPSRDELESRSADGSLGEILNYAEVHKGDCFYIPAGMVHAIGSGIVIAEIQQNSNTTYRLYDYDRVGKDGKKRELHIKQASEVIKTEFPEKFVTNRVEEDSDVCRVTTLCDCSFFGVEKYNLKTSSSVSFCRENMLNILCLSGKGYIKYLDEKFPLEKSSSYLIPASIEKFSVCALDDELEFLVSYAK